MAYSDLSPADVETRLRGVSKPVPKTVPKTVPKNRRTARCPTQAEIWPQHRFRGLVRKRRTLQATIRAAQKAAGGIFLAAAKAAGAAISAGLLEERAKVRAPTPAERLLAQLDAARAVRQVIGRLDVSGATNAAAWASAEERDGVTVLRLFYRHGRDVLADLARVVETLLRDHGWRIGRTLDRIRRAPKMEAGVWEATFTLSPPAG